jgi:hypothetical protein
MGSQQLILHPAKVLLEHFAIKIPGEIHLMEMIPNTTALLYHVSFSDFEEWQGQLSKYWSSVYPGLFDRYLEFEAKYQLSFNWISNEAGNAILETPNREINDQLAFVGITDKDAAYNELSAFAQKLSEEQGDSVYIEIYNDVPIIQLPFKDFPSILLGNYFNGFDNSYVTIYEDYLLIGNSMQVVKNYFSEVENENIWGKSVRKNIFLENTLSETNFSMMINTSLCWNMMLSHLNEHWVEIFNKKCITTEILRSHLFTNQQPGSSILHQYCFRSSAKEGNKTFKIQGCKSNKVCTQYLRSSASHMQLKTTTITNLKYWFRILQIFCTWFPMKVKYYGVTA